MPQDDRERVGKIDYAGNSHKNKDKVKKIRVEVETESESEETPKREKVAPVVTGRVVERKKGFFRQLREHFTSDDAQSVGSYILWDIAVPAFKDLLFDIIKNGAERSIYRDERPSRYTDRRSMSRHTSYDKKFMGREDPRERRELSSRARRSHDFGEIILESRAEVERVLNGLDGLIDQYGVATVNDLYDLLDISGTFQDDRWGWTNLSAARASKVRDGWLLDLPPTEPID